MVGDEGPSSLTSIWGNAEGSSRLRLGLAEASITTPSWVSSSVSNCSAHGEHFLCEQFAISASSIPTCRETYLRQRLTLWAGLLHWKNRKLHRLVFWSKILLPLSCLTKLMFSITMVKPFLWISLESIRLIYTFDWYMNFLAENWTPRKR